MPSPTSPQHEDIRDTILDFSGLAEAAIAGGHTDLTEPEIMAMSHHLDKAREHYLTSARHHMEGDHFSAVSHLMSVEEHASHAGEIFNAGFQVHDIAKKAVNLGLQDALRNAVNSYSWNNPPTPQGKVK